MVRNNSISWVVILAAIWLPVIYLLGAQWSVYEQYNYGWAVPALCVFLAWQKTRDHRLQSTGGTDRHLSPALSPVEAERKSSCNPVVLLVVFWLVFWLMRIFQEANPIWRLASYGLAMSAVAITLLAIYLTGGQAQAWHFAFPVMFFLVAVPWPTAVETAVVQTLTRFNSGLVVEVMNLCGIPALLHGNVIEVSTGMVGIDEACSGIRSLQATLMIALFFGAVYGGGLSRRLLAVLGGAGLALVFNLIRTLTLVSIAAHYGLPAMERWHDGTGVAMLLACFVSVWVLCVWLARHGRRGAEMRTPIARGAGKLERADTAMPTAAPASFAPWRLAVATVAASLIVGVSTEWWFRSHEARGTEAISWAARWPVTNPTFQTNILSAGALKLLQCDIESAGGWRDPDGSVWQAFYLRWLPANSFYGRVKAALSKTHNPEICLTASGMKLKSALPPVSLPVRPGFSLSFRRYVFEDEGQILYVFFSETEDMIGHRPSDLRATNLARVRAALAGSRNYGQRNLEIAISGVSTADAALRLFRERLPSLIQFKPVATAMR